MMERKQTEAIITTVDEAQGIVEAIWAVMGNVDEVGDIIHPGAFTKTFSERGNQIKLLDNHRTDSVMASLGVVKELREVKRAELPQEMMNQHADVTGGAWGRFQFLLDTPEGKGAFSRIKSGAVHQWSFGYDAVDKDYSNKDGKSVRNLRGIKLYEVSPVLFPANSATTTTAAKAAPSEGKPYGVIPEGDEFCVYKLDAEGKPTGKPMGRHPTEAEARTQMRALYASEEEDKSDDTPEDKAGRVLSDRNAKRIKAAMAELHNCLMEAGLMEMPKDETESSKPTGPQKSDTLPPTSESASEAGPNEDTRTRYLKLIEIEQEKLKLLEV
jgi:HK97 family phage prohead protease